MVFPSTESRRRHAPPREGKRGARYRPGAGVRRMRTIQCTLPGYCLRDHAAHRHSPSLHCELSKKSVRSHTLTLEMGCYDPYN